MTSFSLGGREKRNGVFAGETRRDGSATDENNRSRRGRRQSRTPGLPGLVRKLYDGGAASGSGWDSWADYAAMTPTETVIDTNGINDGSDGGGGTVDLLAANSLASLTDIDIGVGGRMNAKLDNVLTSGSTVDVNPYGVLTLEAAQVSPPTVVVQGAGILMGDGSSRTYGAGGNTVLEDDAVIAFDPTVPDPYPGADPNPAHHPTAGDHGRCNIFLGVTAMGVAYPGLGRNDDAGGTLGGDISTNGPAWEGVYKGVVFDDIISAAGPFTGTLAESESDATTVLDHMTLAGGIARNGYAAHGVAVDTTDLDILKFDVDQNDWPTDTVRLGGGGGLSAETALAPGTEFAFDEILNKVGNNTLRLLAGTDNYIDHTVVDGGRVIAEDQGALGADTGTAFTVTVNHDGEIELHEGEPDPLTAFSLNDRGVMDLQGNAYAVLSLSLGTGADAVLTGGAGSVLDLTLTSSDRQSVEGAGALTLDGGTTVRAMFGGPANFHVGNAATLAVGGNNYNATDPGAARTFYWNVAAGTLDATGDAGALGADAYGWAFADKRDAVVGQHLEGIEVQSGAALAWTGTHGSLDPSVYGGLPAGQGDGLQPGELLLHDNATLQGAGLALGFYQQYTDPGTGAEVTDTYPLYPTVITNSAAAVNLTGQIELRSGLQLGGTEEGPLTVHVSGDVAFGNTGLIDRVNAAGGSAGVDVVDHLNVESGTAGIHRSHTRMQTTQVATADTLAIDPDGAAGAPVTYAGPIANEGTLTTQSGDVTLTGDIENNGAAAFNGTSVLLQGNVTNNGSLTFGADTGHAAGAAFDSTGAVRAAGGTTTVDAKIVSPEPDPGVVSAPAAGIRTYYSFNNTPADTIGGHNLTLQGTAGYDTGYVGNALSLDGGAGNFAEDDDGEAYINGLPGFTVAMWIKSNQTGTDRGMFIAHEPTGQDRFLTFRYDVAGASSGNTPNVIKGGVSSTTDEEYQFESAEGVQATEWQHLAMTWGSLDPDLDGNTADAVGDGFLRLYIDGIEADYAFEEAQGIGGVVTNCTTVLQYDAGTGTLNGGGWLVRGTLVAPAGSDITAIGADADVALDGAASAIMSGGADARTGDAGPAGPRRRCHAGPPPAKPVKRLPGRSPARCQPTTKRPLRAERPLLFPAPCHGRPCPAVHPAGPHRGGAPTSVRAGPFGATPRPVSRNIPVLRAPRI